MHLTRFALWLVIAAITTSTIDLTGGRPVSASMERAAAANPVEAVQAIVRPYYVPGYSFITCSTRLPMHRRIAAYATCPMTSRLRWALNHRPRGVEGTPFDRSETGPRTVRVQQRSNNGHTAYVNAWWDFGSQSFTTTFVVKHQGGGWLVDDEYCAGRPNTSLYRGQQPCW